MRTALSVGRGVILAAAVAVAAIVLAPPAIGHAVPYGGAVETATIGSIAAQIGVRVVGTSRTDDEFNIGTQFTGLLVDPVKLTAFGLKGMRAGARVVAARVGTDRVYIEADELDPPRRESVRVTIDVNGRLVRPPNV